MHVIAILRFTVWRDCENSENQYGERRSNGAPCGGPFKRGAFMSEVLRLPEGECTRAHALLAGFVDGELTPAQSEWLGGHLDGCRECRAALDAFAEIDCELTGWGKRTE